MDPKIKLCGAKLYFTQDNDGNDSGTLGQDLAVAIEHIGIGTICGSHVEVNDD